LALSGVLLIAIVDYTRGEVLSLTDSVTVTGDIPHLMAVAIKPESRIPPIGNDTIQLDIEIRPPSSLVPIASLTVTANSSGVADLGSISASSVPPGVYDIAIKGLSHLRKVYPNQNLDGPAVRSYSLLIPQLPAGDANPTADNYVNSLDIAYVTLQLYSADNRADLTHDGLVNSLDYAALLRNITTYGDN
jgi:hypothetical protein